MARKRRQVRSGRRRWLLHIVLAVLALVVLSFVLVLPLRWHDPATTAFMLQDASGREPLLHQWVAWDDLGTSAPLAVVGAEDQRFAEHFGLDIGAIQDAIEDKDKRGSLRGASTISQQTAKNLFLWPGKNFLRKGLEAWLTIVTEICLPKRRILEIYLNVAEFGPGIYGVGAASQYYFGRPPAHLSDPQAALLAAVLPNPRRLHVSDPSDYVRERQRWIYSQIRRLRREAWLLRIQ